MLASISDHTLGIGAFTLGFLGIGVGGYAIAIGIRTDRRVKAASATIERVGADLDAAGGRLVETVQKLDAVRDSLPTRALGSFPAYCERIVSMLGSATKSIDILCDYSAYGAFSRPEAAREYQQLLRRRKVDCEYGFTLSIVCLPSEHRVSLMAAQFPVDQWDQFDEDVTRFVRTWDKHDPDKGCSRDRFLELVAAVDADMAGEVGTRVADGLLPIYCWIVDREQAIFSVAAFPTPKAEARRGDGSTSAPREVGFHTSDPGLVSALARIFDLYSNASQAWPGSEHSA